jgi:hypothetical protein
MIAKLRTKQEVLGRTNLAIASYMRRGAQKKNKITGDMGRCLAVVRGNTAAR